MTTPRIVKALIQPTSAKRGSAAACAELDDQSASESESEEEEYYSKNLKKRNPYSKNKNPKKHQVLEEASGMAVILLQVSRYAANIKKIEEQLNAMYQVIQGISAKVRGRDEAAAQIQKYCETLAEASKSAVHRMHYLNDNQASGLRWAASMQEAIGEQFKEALSIMKKAGGMLEQIETQVLDDGEDESCRMVFNYGRA